MNWYLSFLFYIVLVASFLWFRYSAAAQILGREAGRRILRSTIVLLLLGFALAKAIALLGKYGWIGFYLLYAVATSVWLLSWSFRKKKAGELQLNVGRTAQNKFIFWFGMLGIFYAICLTYLFVLIVSSIQVANTYPASTDLSMDIAILAFWWSCAISLVAIGLNRLEIRENGICFMYAFVAWQSIISYHWERSQPNTLTIQFKPYIRLFPRYKSMAIPTKHREVVSHLVQKHLPSTARRLSPEREAFGNQMNRGFTQ